MPIDGDEAANGLVPDEPCVGEVVDGVGAEDAVEGLVPDEDDAEAGYPDGATGVCKLLLGTDSRCVGIGFDCRIKWESSFACGDGARSDIAGSGGVICTKGAPCVGKALDGASCTDGVILISMESEFLRFEGGRI